MVSRKIQKGGFVDALVDVLKVVGNVVVAVFSGLFLAFQQLFAVCPNPDGDVKSGTCFVGKPWDWHLSYKEKHPKAFKYEFRLLTGPAWRFLIMIIKITFFIAIFILGGPIVLLGGLIFLYTQLYSQLNKRVDDPEKTISNNT